MRSLWDRMLDIMFGRPSQPSARSRAIQEEADRTMSTERARLARLRPIIDRLPKREDWQRMYDERIGR